MQDNPCLNDKLQRHRDFWARRPTDRPMIGICRPLGKTAPGFELLGDRPLTPDDVNESLYQAYKHCTTVCTPCADRSGDLFYTMIDSLLDTPELGCIECTVDAGGPTLDELLPLWRRVLEGGKSLLVCLEDEVIASYKFCPQPGERVDIYQSRGAGPEFEYLVAAAEGTGCRVYCDLSPAGDTGRYAEPETYRRLAMDMYDRGIHAPCIWDAHTRHQLPRQWNMIARLGHKDELADMDDSEDALHRDVKVEKIGGETVNRWG